MFSLLFFFFFFVIFFLAFVLCWKETRDKRDGIMRGLEGNKMQSVELIENDYLEREKEREEINTNTVMLMLYSKEERH